MLVSRDVGNSSEAVECVLGNSCASLMAAVVQRWTSRFLHNEGVESTCLSSTEIMPSIGSMNAAQSYKYSTSPVLLFVCSGLWDPN